MKVSLVLAEGADPSKAAAAAADLLSQPKGFAVKSRAAPPTSLALKRPRLKLIFDDPAAPAVDLKPRSWRRQEHGRWEPVQAEAGASSPKDAASERLAHFLQHAEEAEAAAARAERASPDRPSAASAENWQGRNPASTWVQRKKARAAAYEQSGGARQTRTPAGGLLPEQTVPAVLRREGERRPTVLVRAAPPPQVRKSGSARGSGFSF